MARGRITKDQIKDLPTIPRSYISNIISVDLGVSREYIITHNLNSTTIIVNKMERLDNTRIWACNISTQLGGSGDYISGGIVQIIDNNNIQVVYNSPWGNGVGSSVSHGIDSFDIGRSNVGELRVIIMAI